MCDPSEDWSSEKDKDQNPLWQQRSTYGSMLQLMQMMLVNLEKKIDKILLFLTALKRGILLYSRVDKRLRVLNIFATDSTQRENIQIRQFFLH